MLKGPINYIYDMVYSGVNKFFPSVNSKNTNFTQLLYNK